MTFKRALKCVAGLSIAAILFPSLAAAQVGGGGGGGGGGAVQDIQQVMKQLDLKPDQQKKMQQIWRQTQGDLREAMQGMADATPEERMSKMQDAEKIIAGARTKVEAELTPEQKAKYFPLSAQTGLKHAVDLVAALKLAAAKMDLPDDQHKQLNDIFDDSAKTLDSYKDDAAAVKDDDGLTDFTKKLGKFQLDLRKQIVNVIGKDDTQKLMQSARQGMTGGAGARLRKTAGATTSPATAPGN
jgi:Spy/CpxP family protein refolding chaperone